MKMTKKIKKKNDLCKRCGKCCILSDGVTDCPFLIRLENGLTECSIYEWRLGTIVCNNPLQICVSIHNKTRNHYPKGCPYT